jgi:hypothetical protein
MIVSVITPSPPNKNLQDNDDSGKRVLIGFLIINGTKCLTEGKLMRDKLHISGEVEDNIITTTNEHGDIITSNIKLEASEVEKLFLWSSSSFGYLTSGFI